MTKSRRLVLALLSCAAGLIAVTEPTRLFAQANSLFGSPPAEIGPDSRSWGPAEGGGSGHAGGMVEIATGMNYWDPVAQQWTPSDPSFVEAADGNSFSATHVQHQTYLSSDLDVTGAVTVVTAGLTLRSTPIGIGIYDAGSGAFALIGSITNCIGVQVSSNCVVFNQAFQGVCASVVYTLHKGSFAQDVVFSGLLDPTAYGFPQSSSNSLRIQVITELYSPPQPDIVTRPLYVEQDQAVRQRMVTPDFMDQTIGFGQFVLGPLGKAYTQATPDNPNGTSAPVAKQVTTSGGRTFLIESVRYSDVRDALLSLPPCSPGSSGQARTKPRMDLRRALASMPSPARVRRQIARHGQQRLARAFKPTGVTVDYIATLGGTLGSAMVFNSSTNYFVSDAVYCNAGATIEPTIFKYKQGASIQFNSTLTCKGSMYRPIICTAVDDDTVGDTLNGWPGSGYTGVINTNGYANPAISSQNTLNLSNFRFCYAQVAIANSNAFFGQVVTVSHSQFLNCIRGISLASGSSGSGSGVEVTVNNVLLSNVAFPFSFWPAANSTFSLVNCTIDHASQVVNGNYLTVTSYNSIYANVVELVDTISGSNNGFYNSPTFGTSQYVVYSSPFQSVGAGNYYLTDASGFRNVGTTTGVSSSLLAALQQRTTYPPLVFADLLITNNMTLSPQVQRDTDTLDLGFHPEPLDFAFGFVLVTNATVTVNPGTVIATFGTNAGTYGLAIGQNAQFQCQGLANAPNWIVQYNTVQEQPTTNWFRTSSGSLISEFEGLSPGATINCRFTDWSILSLDAPQSNAPTNRGPINFQDCQFHSGKLLSAGPTINLTNCLLEREYTLIQPTDGLTSYVQNCTVFGGSFSFAPSNSVIQANLFDSAAITNLIGAWGNTYSGGFNAYVTTNYGRLFPTNSRDIILSASPAYQAGPLENYYLLSTSTLINADTNTLASQVGLFHYTVMTNMTAGAEIKETNSFLDIGFHGVAVDSSGNPIDSNGDGIPDYISDANGNGLVDSGEVGWNIVGDLGLKVIITRPKNGTTLP